MKSSRRRPLAVDLALLAALGGGAAAAAACGGGSSGSLFDLPQGLGSADGGAGESDGGLGLGSGSNGDGGGLTIGTSSGDFDPSTFALTPATTTLDVTDGTPPTPLTFIATDHGEPVSASYRIADRGELASVGLTTGAFAVSGALGGTVTVAADYMGSTATATVTIRRHTVGNGASDALTVRPTSEPDGGAVSSVSYFGAGGYGGVGGDGSGAAVSAAQQTALDAATGTSDGADWLYPYDQTVFPREVLAPLLQWNVPSGSDYQAVKIHLVEANYEYTGYFAKPVLATTFGDHPIPADVWTNLYSSYTSATGKEDVQVTVTLLPQAAGVPAFTLATRTWHIAGGSLRGKIYYQSYGSRLATPDLEDYNGQPFGGATLAIQPGASAPDAKPAAGSTACRVCHSVAAGGSSLITQHGDGSYGTASQYDLSTGAETVLGTVYPYSALSPDGTVIFTSAAPIANSGSPPSSSFLQSPTLTQLQMTTVPANLQAYFPTFSSDGTHVAYDDGTANALTEANVDLAAKTFAAPTTVFTPPSGQHAYWPSFTPTGDGLVFEVELKSNGRDIGATRSSCDKRDGTCLQYGTHGELWYVSLTSGKAHRLDSANGDSYLPLHPSAYHDSTTDDRPLDDQFNYEPTVNPVVSGGYAWVVFTSRRLYGNVATINPFVSDPRFSNISTTPTTKKLWVAAIDLSADGSTDASFPAFYLPGQELLAGNGRGYWVVDPCQSDNTSCETGDQCCGGYCQAAGDGGALVCSAVKPMCAAQYDKCSTASDCCDSSLSCIAGRCSVSSPR